jgi:hypothetical protein
MSRSVVRHIQVVILGGELCSDGIDLFYNGGYRHRFSDTTNSEFSAAGEMSDSSIAETDLFKGHHDGLQRCRGMTFQGKLQRRFKNNSMEITEKIRGKF